MPNVEGDNNTAEINVTTLYGQKGDKGENGESIKGDKGDQGDQGVGISTIDKTESHGLIDVYTITYSDSSDENNHTATYNIVNGNGIKSIEKTITNGLVDTYTITFDAIDNNVQETEDEETENPEAKYYLDKPKTFTFTVTNGKDGKGEKGDQGIQGVRGEKGEKGDTGASVTSVKLVSTVGLDKTYRMTFNDGTYADFTVSDGAAGQTQWGGVTGEISNQHDLIELLATKQDVISDLETIRANAKLGSTALQSVPDGYVTETQLNSKNYATTADIPTDTHINELIDTKLGTIENGSY